MNDYLDAAYLIIKLSVTEKRLIDQFRDQIIITELDGKSNACGDIQVYSQNILHQFHESPKQEDIVSGK